MSDLLLSVKNLTTSFRTNNGPLRAVDNVSFDIRRGETVALLGESGCGKSMTALSLMRLIPEPAGSIDGGSIMLDGEDLMQLPEAAMRRVRGNRMAMIFQEPMSSLNPVITIGEQIAETVRRHSGIKGAAVKTRVVELLDAVGISDAKQRYGEYPHQLSGGMKQRVMIAIALAGEPDLLIADEPTTALDVTVQAQVLELLKDLQKQTGMAILMITHDLGVVSGMADRVAVMYAGQVIENASRDAFFAKPNHPYSVKLFQSLPDMSKRREKLTVINGMVPPLTTNFTACRFAPRCDHAWAHCHEAVPAWQHITINQDDNQIVRCHLFDARAADARIDVQDFQHTDDPVSADADGHASDHDADALVVSSAVLQGHDDHHGEQPVAQSHDKALLEVDTLKVHFPIHRGLFKRVVGHVRAVDGVSLSIPKGRTLALVGESGCGKTTIGKAIMQLYPRTEGRVLLDGDDLAKLSASDLRKRRSDFQIIFQDPFSSMNPRMVVGDIIREGMDALDIVKGREAQDVRIADLLEQVGLSADVSRRYPHEFSGGQRQRICIARALAVDPQLLVCDEPTSALDVSVQAQILNLMKSLQADRGLSYLFITHNLSVVAYLADEVAVMYLGRIVEHGSVADILEAPKHPYTQALLSAIPVIDKTALADQAEQEHPREIIRLAGELPSPANPPQGCHFHTRCPQAMDKCKLAYPPSIDISDGHKTSCYLYGE